MENINNFSVKKGTRSEYEAEENKNSSTLYILTDTGELYLGQQKLLTPTDSFHNSNYNGFLIKKTFDSIQAMNDDFAQGDNSEVAIGEYVVISTTNSQDNGKIYRKASDETAEFVMRFQGPPGQPSILQFNTTQQIAENAETDSITPIEKTLSVSSQSLIPGRVVEDGVESFNDDINLSYYHKIVNDQDYLNVGLTIPYPTFEFETQVLGANQLPKVVDESYTDGVKTHPFHNKLKFQLPQTAHGDSIGNLRITNAAVGDGIDYGNLDPLIVAEYRDKNTPILVYDKTTYDTYNSDEESNGATVTTTFASEFKLIDNIDISEEGYLRFWLPYSDNDSVSISSSTSVVPNIVDFTLSENGQLSVVWEDFQGNQITKTLTPQLKWITGIHYNTDGTMSITWNTLDENEQQEVETVTPPTFITDIMVYNRGLYKSFIGINNEIKLITGLTDAELEEANDAAVNSRANRINTYHKEIQNNKQIWYKKIFDFNLLSDTSNLSNDGGN